MNLTPYQHVKQNLVYVVFQDEVSLWWLHLLKKNFRHCYVLLPDIATNSYLELNPFSNRFVVVTHHFDKGFEYLQFLQTQGKLICPVEINCPDNPAPWFFFTCVEFVKRFIGLQERSIITPYQLYRKLNLASPQSVPINHQV